jgi:hypothetical protein
MTLLSPTRVPQEARSRSEAAAFREPMAPPAAAIQAPPSLRLNDTSYEDQLSAVRGILIGALISSAVWGAAIASLIYWID